MTLTSSVHHSSLIPPFASRIPLPAISLPSTNLETWQRNFDIKLRLHNIRMLLAARLSADEFLAEQSQTSVEIIHSTTNWLIAYESALFNNLAEESVYQEDVAIMVGNLMKRYRQLHPETVPSLIAQSFRAVWKKMAIEEQEEFALQFNSNDPGQDLREFISQKTATSRRFTERANSQEDIPESPSKRQKLP